MSQPNSSKDGSSSRSHTRRKRSGRSGGGNGTKDGMKDARSGSGSSTRLSTPAISLPEKPTAGGSVKPPSTKKNTTRRGGGVSSKSREGSAKPMPPPPPPPKEPAPPLPPIQPNKNGAIDTNDDFVAFGVSSEDEVDDSVEVPQPTTPAGPSHAGTTGSGRKRKADEISKDDGYANKKLKEQADMRRTPWAANVDWHVYPDVAQMYVLFLDKINFYWNLDLFLKHLHFAGYMRKLARLWNTSHRLGRNMLFER